MQEFAAAVGTVVPAANNAYTTVEQTYYDTQVAAVVLNYDKSGFQPDKIKPFLSPHDLGVRADLLRALQAYADDLAMVTSDSNGLDAARTGWGNRSWRSRRRTDSRCSTTFPIML